MTVAHPVWKDVWEEVVQAVDSGRGTTTTTNNRITADADTRTTADGDTRTHV